MKTCASPSLITDVAGKRPFKCINKVDLPESEDPRIKSLGSDFTTRYLSFSSLRNRSIFWEFAFLMRVGWVESSRLLIISGVCVCDPLI